MYIQSDGYTWYILGYTMYISCICRTSESTYTGYIQGIFQAYTSGILNSITGIGYLVRTGSELVRTSTY